MDNYSISKQSNTLKKLIFFFTLATHVYWIIVRFGNVYKIKLIGVFFEILWLPLLITLIVLPVLAFIFWAKEKFILKSYYFILS